MKTIYIDTDNKCHIANDGTMIAVETALFDGKCNSYIGGHCMEIYDECSIIYPWKPYSELDAAQREYERQLLAEYESALHEIEKALGV